MSDTVSKFNLIVTTQFQVCAAFGIKTFSAQTSISPTKDVTKAIGTFQSFFREGVVIVDESHFIEMGPFPAYKLFYPILHEYLYPMAIFVFMTATPLFDPIDGIAKKKIQLKLEMLKNETDFRYATILIVNDFMK